MIKRKREYGHRNKGIYYISAYTKKTSANTEISYQRDLKKMAEFLKERGIRNYKDVKELELEGYISYMEREKFRHLPFPEALLL